MPHRHHEIGFAEFDAVINSPVAARNLALQVDGPYVVVDLDIDSDPSTNIERLSELSRLGLFPKVVIGRTTRNLDELTTDQRAMVDLTTSSSQQVIESIERAPEASAALALLLRSGETRTIKEGLLVESIHYSALQASQTHQSWITSRPAARYTAEDQFDSSVLVDRQDNTLRIVLNRPTVHNALNAAMRNELLEALDIARSDPMISVELSGHGRSFCSGGDLREFGLAADPASAHLTRVSASVGLMLSQLAQRTSVKVHGSCVGAGIELPAFASRIVAHPETTFRLPELAFGLIPGAGGTVSIPRRIGRHRTMHLAVLGLEIDTATALDYGLIDAVSE